MNKFRIALLAVALSSTAGCSFRTASPAPGSNMLYVMPEVRQKGAGAQFVQFKPATLATNDTPIVRGPDGNMWFIDENAARLARITMTGATVEFNIESALTGPNAVSMTVGADNDFYILDEGTNVVRVTTAGVAKSFPIPSGDSTSLDGIKRGPDGNVWFAEFNHIGRITPAGTIKEFAYPTQPGTNQYGGVTPGSDGNVWFAESSQDAIGRIVPSTGNITMFPIPVSCTPAAVVLAKDNNVWFFCLANAPSLGRITPSGSIKTFSIGGFFNSNETMQFCSRGPDGEPWCASDDGTLFRVNTGTDTITTFHPPLPALSRPESAAAGPDGNIWMDTTGEVQAIDVLVIDPMTVTPRGLVFTTIGSVKTLTVSEAGTSAWTAVSSNKSIATVSAGGSSSIFDVKAVKAGTCTVTIADAVGNSVAIVVTVK